MESFVWQLAAERYFISTAATTCVKKEKFVASKFADPVHSVPLDGPIQLCSDYNMTVLFRLEERDQTSVP